MNRILITLWLLMTLVFDAQASENNKQISNAHSTYIISVCSKPIKIPQRSIQYNTMNMPNVKNICVRFKQAFTNVEIEIQKNNTDVIRDYLPLATEESAVTYRLNQLGNDIYTLIVTSNGKMLIEKNVRIP